jgi:hypothetical protein
MSKHFITQQVSKKERFVAIGRLYARFPTCNRLSGDLKLSCNRCLREAPTLSQGRQPDSSWQSHLANHTASQACKSSLQISSYYGGSYAS